MKKYLFLFLVFFCMSGISAQDFTQNQLNMLADSCSAPQVTSKSILNYDDDKSDVLLRFMSNSDFDITIKPVGSTNDIKQLFVKNGVVEILDLQSNMEYKVYGKNVCDEKILIYSFSTNEGFQDEIEVSPALFETIADFQQQKEVSLTEYLSFELDIPLLERVAFLQQFNRFGMPIDKYDIVDDLSSLTLITPRDTSITCSCRSLRLASPSFNPGFSTVQQNIMPELVKYHQVSYSWADKKNAHYWYQGEGKGAAKWHDLITEGWKAPYQEPLHKEYGGTNFTNSANFARISMNLLCIDGNELPAKCACDKPLWLYGRYDTEVRAKAKILGSTNARKSWAVVEDLGIFVASDDSGYYEVLGGVGAKASSSCNRQINKDFGISLINLAASIIKVIPLGIDSVTIADTIISNDEIDDIANALGSVIEEPVWVPGSCGQQQSAPHTIEIKKKVFLKVNTPFYFSVYSMDTMDVGGQRKWASEARVLSDFYLNAIIPGGKWDPNYKSWCCTPIGASWVLGSCDGPLSTQKLRKEVATKMFLRGVSAPYETINGQLHVPSDYGNVAHLSAANCEAIPIQDHHIHAKLAIPKDEGYSVSVYTVNGQFVSINDFSDINDYSRKAVVFSSKQEIRNKSLPSSVYIISVMSKSGKMIDAFKIFVQKD